MPPHNKKCIEPKLFTATTLPQLFCLWHVLLRIALRILYQKQLCSSYFVVLLHVHMCIYMYIYMYIALFTIVCLNDITLVIFHWSRLHRITIVHPLPNNFALANCRGWQGWSATVAIECVYCPTSEWKPALHGPACCLPDDSLHLPNAPQDREQQHPC